MIEKLKKFLAVAAVLLFGIIVFMGWWLFDRHDVYPASIYVESGQPFYQVVVDLRDRGIVKSPWLFSKFGILINLDRRIIPGRYDFEKRTSNFDILRKLWLGDIAYLMTTVPEGCTLEQIGKMLHQRCGVDRDEFDRLVRDSGFLAGLRIYSGFAEGYLFPETYNFQWGISAEEAIKAMASQLFSRIDQTILDRSDFFGYSLHELLTMASIIEREGREKDEYGKIASVYHNRYTAGMKLQADPTVIYGMGGLDRPLRVKDYKFQSAYNTYLHEGLPPTPICSPGMTAIMAALYPDSTDYLYFVADGKGRHVFNKTYQQHVKETKRIKRELKD